MKIIDENYVNGLISSAQSSIEESQKLMKTVEDHRTKSRKGSQELINSDDKAKVILNKADQLVVTASNFHLRNPRT